jgi:uncharacterized protein YPO0396
MAEFRRLPRAITKAGQIKGGGGRHEKDDRKRIDDRSTYVLGWSSERKADALLNRATALAARLTAIGAEENRHKKARDASVEHGQVLAGLDQTREFADIDWQSMVNRAEGLKSERRALEAASTELARLNRELEKVKKQVSEAEGALRAVSEHLGGVESRIRDASKGLAEARATLGEPGRAAAQALFAPIGDLLGRSGQARPSAAGDCDKAERQAAGQISELAARRTERKARLSNRIVAAMGEFRRQYPAETSELNDSPDSADGYRELHQRLTHDDLPRFREQFKTYLNQNTIRDVAGFQSQLNKQAEVIRDRIATINASLIGIDYNPGRYIRLEAQPTPTALTSMSASTRGVEVTSISSRPGWV